MSDTHNRALEVFGEQAEERVRRVWYEGRLWFSVVDAVGLLTDSANPGTYWRVLKLRLREEGADETVTLCNGLRMRAAAGKQRVTDAADVETLLRIVQSIPSPKAEPFKQWLARVGAQRLEELTDPGVAADSLRLKYQRAGCTDEWIGARLQNIMTRDDVTAEWREIKGIKGRANLRDNMTRLELALSTLAEATATELHQTRDSQGFIDLQRDAGEAGEVAGAARQDIEARTGQRVVSSQNARQLTARAEQPRLLGADDPIQQ